MTPNGLQAVRRRWFGPGVKTGDLMDTARREKPDLGTIGCYRCRVLGLTKKDPICWYSFEEHPPSQRIEAGTDTECVPPERKTERS
jgi:hypothetical protein